MPLSYRILEKFGTTQARLQELLTASPMRLPRDATDDQKEENRLDCEMRREIEEIISNRIDEAILDSLKSSHLYAAADLAWDSSTITRKTVPLVLYAQRMIDLQAAVTSLEGIEGSDQYIKRNDVGTAVGIDLPRFCEVNINLVRSVITRRVAAQSARFTNLYPFFKFETRGTSEVDKLRGDLLSQRADINADQFGYRASQIDWIRDMLMYAHSVAFPAQPWQRDVEWFDEDEEKAEEYRTGKTKASGRCVREGVPLTLPHTGRVFSDKAHPLKSINTDSGCEWFGFWDVDRYGEIAANPHYFNRKEIGYNGESTSWFDTYSSYFSQYYCTLTPPVFSEKLSDENDRKAQLGKYTGEMRDAAVYKTHLYWKIKPNQWRMGDYPHPVWLHLTVANSSTVIHAEIMPDTPGFVFSLNESPQRLVNLSMAHELLPFQDQLTNLYTCLLETVKRDLFGIAALNLDAFPAESSEATKALADFRAAMKVSDFTSAITTLEFSFTKMRDLGVNLDIGTSVFKIIRDQTSRALNEIIQAIAETIKLAERVMALSPQEQAQLSPRETSATEVQVIAGTTENIYQFISDAIDEGRAAIKRYFYNALMSCGTEEIYLPVVNRYRPDVAKKANLRIEDLEDVQGASADSPRQFMVAGNKRSLIAEYIFNSRDGADRASNIQAAQTLTQMLGILMQPAVLAMLTKDRLADIINAIIRQSGAGVDVLIEPPPGEGATPVMAPQPPPGAAVDPAMNGAPAESLGIADTAPINLPRA